MAQQTSPKDAADLKSSRYSERASAQYSGGDIDPTTGNVLPAGKAAYSQGNTPTPTPTAGAPDASAPAAAPAAAGVDMPKSRLADVTASTPAPTYTPPNVTLPSGPSSSSALTNSALGAGLNAAAGLAAKGIGNALGLDGKGTAGSSDDYFNGKGGSTGQPQSSGGGPLATPTSGSSSADVPLPTPDPRSANASTDMPDYGKDLPNYGDPQYDIPQAPAPSPTADNSAYNPATYSPSPEPAPYVAPPPVYNPPTNSYGGGDDEGGGGGDSVICTELHRQGLLDTKTYAADTDFGAIVRLKHPHVYAGYIVWAPLFVKLMKASPAFTAIVDLLAQPWAQHMAKLMGTRAKSSLFGWFIFHVGWAICAAIGRALELLAPLRPAH